MVKSYQPQFFVGDWSGNALRFATEPEAHDWAENYFKNSGWTLPLAWRANPTEDPPKHRLVLDEEGNFTYHIHEYSRLPLLNYEEIQ